MMTDMLERLRRKRRDLGRCVFCNRGGAHAVPAVLRALNVLGTHAHTVCVMNAQYLARQPQRRPPRQARIATAKPIKLTVQRFYTIEEAETFAHELLKQCAQARKAAQ